METYSPFLSNVKCKNLIVAFSLPVVVTKKVRTSELLYDKVCFGNGEIGVWLKLLLESDCHLFMVLKKNEIVML